MRDEKVRWIGALLVCLGSALGALAGVGLTFPAVGAAVLFVPYAVLCAALIASPPRYWGPYLLASSLGTFLPHFGDNADLSFVLLAEVSNWSRALAAAIGIRWLCSREGGLNDLRGMSIFLLFAAGIGPVLGASLGALFVVLTGPSDHFWLTWGEWFLSNALTALTLIPSLLSAMQLVHGKRAALSRSRALEALALLIGLFSVGAAVFVFSRYDLPSLPVRMYWPLPFLLWMAVRFSPAATSGSVLLVALLTLWGAFYGRGPFVADSPTANLLNLQFFLVALSLPLLLLSALMQQARRTAEELGESKRQYRSVADAQTELICRMLPDGTYTFVNAAYAAAHGREPEAFLGRTIGELLGPDAHAAVRARISAITRDAELVTQEIEVTDPSGQPRWEQWRDRGFFDAAGKIREYQAVGRDITDRLRAEQEKRRLAAQTEIALALREADRKKDEFLAMLGHELRNPLAPLRMAVELLRQRGPIDPETDRAHDVIARQVGHMTRLVDDLLDVSRITRGVIELRREALDLRDVIANGIETTAPVLDGRRHEMVVSLPDTPLRVRGDATRLAQVVANLLHNAAKYTAAGGRIELTLRRDGACALLSVRDNGIGIPPASLGCIFDLFAQAPNRGDMARGGLGIGLTLVQRLVALHGGSIEARSEGPGRGSEFILKLPELVTALPRAPSMAAEPALLPDAQLKVMVVDDNIDAAQILAQLLSRWGHVVRMAHDGVAALETARTLTPDVVLLDLDLPKIDGFEVARLLRQSHDSSRLMLVAVTGFGQRHHFEQTRRVGFDHHFVKPVDIPALRTLLRRRVEVVAAPPG